MNHEGQKESKIIVKVEADLEDLIPGYLENRRKDIQEIPDLLKSGDYESVRLRGHSMKGSGGGYGFEAISLFGRAIEDSAKRGEAGEILDNLDRMSRYLDNLEVVYV